MSHIDPLTGLEVDYLDIPPKAVRLDHPATPRPVRFDWVPQLRNCATCGRYLRRSKTSPTGWRHSGLRP